MQANKVQGLIPGWGGGEDTEPSPQVGTSGPQRPAGARGLDSAWQPWGPAWRCAPPAPATLGLYRAGLRLGPEGRRLDSMLPNDPGPRRRIATAP